VAAAFEVISKRFKAISILPAASTSQEKAYAAAAPGLEDAFAIRGTGTQPGYGLGQRQQIPAAGSKYRVREQNRRITDFRSDAGAGTWVAALVIAQSVRALGKAARQQYAPF